MYTYYIVVRHTVVGEGDPLIFISICIFQYVHTYHMYTNYIAFVYILYYCAAHRCRRRQLSSMSKYHEYVHIFHCMCIHYIVVQRTGVGGGNLTDIDFMNMYTYIVAFIYVVLLCGTPKATI